MGRCGGVVPAENDDGKRDGWRLQPDQRPSSGTWALSDARLLFGRNRLRGIKRVLCRSRGIASTISPFLVNMRQALDRALWRGKRLIGYVVPRARGEHARDALPAERDAAGQVAVGGGVKAMQPGATFRGSRASARSLLEFWAGRSVSCWRRCNCPRDLPQVGWFAATASFLGCLWVWP